MYHTLIPQTEIDRYLGRLRAGLRRLPHDQAEDIVGEIRSHIHDLCYFEGELSEIHVAATLERLGDATALAADYLEGGKAFTGTPPGSAGLLLMVRSAVRWVALGAIGMFTALAAISGYGLAAVFGICALAKPFSPASAGLWRLSADHVSLQLGIGDPPPAPAQELLGWWIIPVGIGAAVLLAWVTTEIAAHAIRLIGRQCPRLFARVFRSVRFDRA